MDEATLPATADLEPKDIVPRESGVIGPERPSTYPGDGPNAWSSPVSLTDASGLARLFGWGGSDFQYVSPGAALQQGAVMACLDVRAQDVAAAPLTLNRLLTQGNRRRGYRTLTPSEHPIARLFWTRPNEFMTWNEFHQMIVYHLGLVNNAYIIPVRDRTLRVTALIPVLPARVRREVDTETRRVFYRVRAGNVEEAVMYGTNDDDDELILFPNEIIHIRTRAMNGLAGVPTLSVGNKVLALTEALARFQDRIFRRDGTMRGVFQQDKDAHALTQEQYDRLKASLKEALGMLRDENWPLILENGLAFNKISMTAAEAESGKAWTQQLTETARLFRIPPHKIMQFESVKYDNLDSIERLYVRDSLIRPVCLPIEERLSLQLLREEEQLDLYIEFDRHELYASDPNTLSKRTVEEWSKGMITRNQALERIGENPAPGKAGDVWMLPANTYLLDENNQVVATNQASPGSPPDDDAGDQPKPKEED